MSEYRPPFDWKKPDYTDTLLHRAGMLAVVREMTPAQFAVLKGWYADHPADFINDWGMTVDPRMVELGLPAKMPFLLFPKQREWVEWVVEHWKARKPGLSEKSRDFGLSWLAVSTAATLCLFLDDMTIGFGSRKEEYVDKIGQPKSLFWKARQFVLNLPDEFNGGWNDRKDSAHMRLSFPLTGSTMTGEAGDNIGRGDRAAIYFVDESAYLERPQLVEASLSATTNCRIDISSANGPANPFAVKVHAGKIDVFTCHWRDDPRKDEAWYQKQNDELDPVTVAQEIDINYSASVEGILVPSNWLAACVDAHIKLGIEPSGSKRASFDVADEGRDSNAAAIAHGQVVIGLEEWSGKGSDIFASTQRLFDICDAYNATEFMYDADGLGADVRGNSRVINAQREAIELHVLEVKAFRGSAHVHAPESEDVKGRKNIDFFQNRKAQSWWNIRRRAYTTWRAVTEGAEYDPDEIICFDSKALNTPTLASPYGMLAKMLMELGQPTYAKNIAGKIVVNKTPEGMRSPNLADAIMILFGRAHRAPMIINDEALRGI